MELTEKLAIRLAEAVRDDPNAGQRATIQAIYHRYLPYRIVREELGVLEFAAYENALLRLLAGEGGYLEIIDTAARTEIRREMESVNPIVGIYRDYGEALVELSLPEGRPAFAAADPTTNLVIESEDEVEGDTALPLLVWDEGDGGGEDGVGEGIASAGHPGATATEVGEPGDGSGDPPWLAADGESTGQPGEDGAETGLAGSSADDTGNLPAETSAAPAEVSGAFGDEDALPAATIRRKPKPPPAANPDEADRVCGHCDRQLPPIHRLRFCPYCGKSQGPVACDQCGTVLEGGWKYCIRCGADGEPVPLDKWHGPL